MTGSPLPRRPGATHRLRVREIADLATDREDRVAVEEPLEVRVAVAGIGARTAGVLMRTPGHDFELAAGWLCAEGLIDPGAIESVAYCNDNDLRPDQEFNVVTVQVRDLLRALPTARVIDSACGVCGTDSVAEVTGPDPVDLLLDATLLRSLPDRLRKQQAHFATTGGTHGVALADADGSLRVVREDVGRHNALDKAIGHCRLEGSTVPPIAVLSGRIGFELVQKGVVAGITLIVGVGAPTSLAVSLAAAHDRTLVGFTSPRRCVVYTGAHRISV